MPAAARAVALVLLCAGCGEPQPGHPFFAGERPGAQVIAHRGGAGLRPENTLAAFEHAARLGADILEMDLRASADGAVVVLHDATVERTTGGRGRVDQLTLEQLRALNVPALEEVFARLPRRRMLAELKAAGAAFAGQVCTLIRRSDRSRDVLVASYDHASIRAFREVCPEVATAASSREARIFAWTAGVLAPAAQAFVIPYRWSGEEVATAELVARAKRRNLKVHVFTVNDEQDMRALIERGVDGVITDRPDRMLALLGRGETPPTIKR